MKTKALSVTKVKVQNMTRIRTQCGTQGQRLRNVTRVTHSLYFSAFLSEQPALLGTGRIVHFTWLHYIQLLTWNIPPTLRQYG